MQNFYVSLVRDLLGYYILFEAESASAVRKYLEREYLRNGEYRLPWCAVYSEEQFRAGCLDSHAHIIKARCGTLHDGG